jgi:A/G-specific adenine glycosylase
MLPSDPRAFRRALLRWYSSHKRDLPWRSNVDPYRIWVSEIMLQQTRVAAVIPYFERFLARFPDVEALAAADEQQVLVAWAGLGYYSRARNLQKAAQVIAEAGIFPKDYEGIRALPGIGDYTAAAVASIAFGLPYAAVDGNVRRVLSRITAGAGNIRNAADTLLDAKRPGDFNQAMMELGATVCLPRQPLCQLCPVSGFCTAARAGLQDEFPVRVPKRAPKRVSKQLLILRRSNRILLWRRPEASARLAGFWELPEREHLSKAKVGEHLGTFRHTIVNTLHEVSVYAATLDEAVDGFVWLPIRKLHEFPLSTTARKALLHSAKLLP